MILTGKGAVLGKNYEESGEVVPPSGLSDLPLNYEATNYFNFFDTAFSWYNTTYQETSNFVLPQTTSCFYRRTPIVKQIETTKKRYRRVVYEIPQLPNEEHIDKQWNSSLVTKEPDPKMFDSFEDYKKALDEWKKLDETNVRLANEIIPSEYDLEIVKDETKPFFYKESEKPKLFSFPGKYETPSFDGSILKKLHTDYVTQSLGCNPQVTNISHNINKLIGYGSDQPQDTICDLGVKYLSQEEYNYLLNCQNIDVPDSVKFDFYNYTLSNLLKKASIFANTIYSSPERYIPSIIKKCSIFKLRDTLPYYDKPTANIMKGMQNELFLRTFFTLINCFLMSESLKRIFSLNDKECPQCILTHVTGFREQSKEFIKGKFVKNNSSIILDFLKTCTSDTTDIAAIMLIGIFELGSFNVFSESDVLEIFLHIQQTNEKEYNKLLFYATANKEMTKTLLDAFTVNLVAPKPLVPLILTVLKLEPEYSDEKTRKCQWIQKVVTKNISLYMDKKDKDTIDIVYEICKYTNRCINKKYAQLKDLRNIIMNIIMQFAILIDNIEDPLYLAKSIDSLTQFATCFEFNTVVKKIPDSIQKIIISQASANTELCHASAKFIRRILILNNIQVTDTFLNPMFKKKFKSAFESSNNILLGLETLKTFALILQKISKPEKETGENYTLSLFQLGNAQPDILKLAQFFSLIGFNALKCLKTVTNEKPQPLEMKYRHNIILFAETMRIRPTAAHILITTAQRTK